MKHVFCLLILSLVLTSIAVAEDKSYGCGLGRLAAPKNTLSSTTTAASVDYMVPSRECATTSGTSGCKRHDLILNEKMIEHYVAANIELIRIDIAIGSGEYINSLARTFGCKDHASSDFARIMQSEFEVLFPNDTSAKNTVESIKRIINTTPQLQNACSTRV